MQQAETVEGARSIADYQELVQLRRKITGISAILLPFTEAGEIDWAGFEGHVARTAEAGLAPAVNMDTGYANLISEETRREALAHTRAVLGTGTFVAGAFVGDQPGASFARDAYLQQVESIQQHGGTPILFQSFGLTGQSPDGILASYAEIGRHCPEFYGFELGQMFAPFGQIYELETFAALLEIPQCTGIKHSSLSRELEWQRLLIRNERRPAFKLFTGNDLAIDMVMYGSDYLLGLSTFAPDLFARRDAMWEAGEPGFFELNDALQYLGQLTFRPPVPAYKHSAAQFLKLRGWIASDAPHPAGMRRPESDVEILKEIARRLNVLA